jgi:hypothetical protein
MFRLLSFFAPYKSAVNVTNVTKEDLDKAAFKNLLDKLSVQIVNRTDTIEGYCGNNSSPVYSSDDDPIKQSVNHFAAKKSISRLLRDDGANIHYFAIDFGTDFNTWNINEINDLKIFFAVFDNQAIEITVDSDQFLSLETQKLKAFLQSIKAATTGSVILRIAYPNDTPVFHKDMLAIPEEKLKLFFAELPSLAIAPVKYRRVSRESCLEDLMDTRSAIGRDSILIKLRHVAIEVPDKTALKNVLDKLHAQVARINPQKSVGCDGRESAIYFSSEKSAGKDVDAFLEATKGKSPWLIYEENKIEYFALDFGADLNTWNLDEINELRALFLAFENQTIEITVDATQIISTETQKLKAFLQSIKAATTGSVTMRIAYPPRSGKDECNDYEYMLSIPDEKLRFIMRELPDAIIAPVKYKIASEHAILDKLTSARNDIDRDHVRIIPTKKAAHTSAMSTSKEEVVDSGCRMR